MSDVYIEKKRTRHSSRRFQKVRGETELLDCTLNRPAGQRLPRMGKDTLATSMGSMPDQVVTVIFKIRGVTEKDLAKS